MCGIQTRWKQPFYAVLLEEAEDLFTVEEGR
jgi:hypothetical protein